MKKTTIREAKKDETPEKLRVPSEEATVIVDTICCGKPMQAVKSVPAHFDLLTKRWLCLDCARCIDVGKQLRPLLKRGEPSVRNGANRKRAEEKAVSIDTVCCGKHMKQFGTIPFCYIEVTKRWLCPDCARCIDIGKLRLDEDEVGNDDARRDLCRMLGFETLEDLLA